MLFLSNKPCAAYLSEIEITYSKILDCDWFSVRLFDTLARDYMGVQLQASNLSFL